MMHDMRKVMSLVFIASGLTAGEIPDLFSVAMGAYDFTRAHHRCLEFEVEYKFHIKKLKSPLDCLEFRPLLGVMATARGSGYVYLGINFDLLFLNHLLFAPGFAAGGYWKGRGKNLGYPLEFRSGIEVAWQFSDWRRLGVHFYHLSNASLGKRNPGEESLVFYYDIPIQKGFPFYRQ
jgi:hypothetical protein